MITAEYGAEGSPWWCRIAIDPDTATVTFQNCHYQRRFFSWGVDPEYTCRLAELRGLCWNMGGTGGYWSWRKAPVMEVVTPAGRAVVPKAAAGFAAVHEAIVGGIPPDVRLRWYEYPAAQTAIGLLVIFPSGIAATILCAVLVERRLVSPMQLFVVFLVLIPLLFLRSVSPWDGRPPVR